MKWWRMAKGKKVFFLDRDGVINADHGYVYRREEWQWLPNVFEALKKLQGAGFELAIITNQSGIGEGYYTKEDMERLHAWMLEELKKEGIAIAAIGYCPHTSRDDCDCRKPKRGMIDQIAAAIGEINYSQSWVIGDKQLDLELGKNIGAKTALVRSKYWKEKALTHKPDLIVGSLLEAAEQI